MHAPQNKSTDTQMGVISMMPVPFLPTPGNCEELTLHPHFLCGPQAPSAFTLCLSLLEGAPPLPCFQAQYGCYPPGSPGALPMGFFLLPLSAPGLTGTTPVVRICLPPFCLVVPASWACRYSVSIVCP